MSSLKKPLAYPLLKQWYTYINKQKNKDLYHITGMRRSGNHALIHWLLAQLPGQSCFNNNMGPIHPAAKTPIKRAVWNKGKGKHLVISFENKPLQAVVNDYNYSQFGELQKRYYLLLLRDPYNWLASYCAWPEREGNKFRQDESFRLAIINRYKEYAHSFQMYEQDGGKEDELYLAVNFNKWVKEQKYREDLALKLHLNFSDKGRDKVDKQGSGSSFSGTKIKGQDLQVLVRYNHFRNDEFYLELLDSELREIGRNIFGYPLNFLL